MLIKTNNKWDAVRAMINTLLKDPTLYCNWCGKDFDKNEFPCCEEPHVGKHLDFVTAIIEQNKETKKTRNDDFAQNESKTMRWGASIPPRFLMELERAWKNTYNEKLWKDNKELHGFLKEFPAFAVCNRI